MENFQKDIQEFEEITAYQAVEFLQQPEEFILFIGRGTCPYCRRFAPKMKEAAHLSNKRVYFMNSENQSDIEGITAIRTAYKIPTVPGLLVSKAGQVKVVCDSSLSVEDIQEFMA